MNEKKYDNKNRFVLFKNDNVNPKAPKYTGTYTDANNKEWKASAWEKIDRNGNPFISGEISEIKERKSGYDNHNKSKGNGYQPQSDDSEIDF